MEREKLRPLPQRFAAAKDRVASLQANAAKEEREVAAAAAIAHSWEARLANNQGAIVAAEADLAACRAHQALLGEQAAVAASAAAEAAAAAAANATAAGAAVHLHSPLLDQVQRTLLAALPAGAAVGGATSAALAAELTGLLAKLDQFGQGLSLAPAGSAGGAGPPAPLGVEAPPRADGSPGPLLEQVDPTRRREGEVVPTSPAPSLAEAAEAALAQQEADMLAREG